MQAPHQQPIIIAPSLLAADYSQLQREVKQVNRSAAQWLHLDIMDGHFVPNISFGPALVRSIRPYFDRFFDVHLMCSRPEILFEPFQQAGAQQITIHVELGDRVEKLLSGIRALGLKAGLAINPPTLMEDLKPFLSQIDTLLVMTVNPGFGGQPFMEETLSKIALGEQWRQELGLSYHLEVDGGITFETAQRCAESGADAFVSGTGLFGQPSFSAAVNQMIRRVQAVRA